MKRTLSLEKKKMYQGVEKLEIGVGSTLGPAGRPAIIEDQPGHPKLTKDGVTVAKFMNLPDAEENLGAKLVAQAASATVKSAGDGTTTSIVLANAIINAGREEEVSVDFVKGIEEASKEVVKHLEGAKTELTEEYIYNIAHISTNNDDELAKVIADAFIKSGRDGVVDVREAPNQTSVTLDVKPGSYIPVGYTHQHFINNVEMRSCESENPLILVSNATLDEVVQLESLFEFAIQNRRPIIIIGDPNENFSAGFINNVARGTLAKGSCIIQPGMGVTMDGLRDLAALLGATYFDNAQGNSLDFVTPEFFGTASEVKVHFGYTLFNVESNDHVNDKIESLKTLIEESDPSYIEDYKNRLRMLNGKYATLKVGAPTKAMALEIKDRVDDAVQAVGSARDGGYLPGGGVALRDASNKIERKEEKCDKCEGYNFLLDAIKAPNKKILENAGLPFQDDLEDGFGVDATSGKVVNMVDKGIIDPAFVTIQSVINATSAASALLLSGATLILVQDE